MTRTLVVVHLCLAACILGSPIQAKGSQPAPTSFACKKSGDRILVDFHSNKPPAYLTVKTPEGTRIAVGDYQKAHEGIRIAKSGGDTMLSIGIA